MPRKIKYNRLSLLNIFENLNEFLDKDISTTFRIIDYGDYICYNFKTNSDTEYDLELHYTEEPCDTKLSNGMELSSFLPKKCINGMIEGFDIGFTLTSVENKDNPECNRPQCETDGFCYDQLNGIEQETVVIEQAPCNSETELVSESTGE